MTAWRLDLLYGWQRLSRSPMVLVLNSLRRAELSLRIMILLLLLLETELCAWLWLSLSIGL